MDVRVLAATNRDLSAEVDAGKFRLALRDRKDDVLVLAKYFVERFAAASGRKVRNIDGRTLELLQSYNWPGNIRELQNVLQRAVILGEGGTISIEDASLRRGGDGKKKTPVALDSFLIEQEKELIEAALEETRGRTAARRVRQRSLGCREPLSNRKLESSTSTSIDSAWQPSGVRFDRKLRHKQDLFSNKSFLSRLYRI